MANVFLHNNDEGHEQPIAFFNQVLRDVELKYNILEKHAYTFVKALKAFRIYILQSNITVDVPAIVVKDILVQGDSEAKGAKWIAKT